jgi:hypothetical protein
MSLVLVNGMVLAIDGIPVDMGSAPVLLAPTISITDIAQDGPTDPQTVSVAITNRDASATAITLHFFVRETGRAVQSAIVASTNATVTPEFAAGLVLPGETLWCRATSTAGTVRSNPSAPVSLAFNPATTGAAIPATVPFAI